MLLVVLHGDIYKSTAYAVSALRMLAMLADSMQSFAPGHRFLVTDVDGYILHEFKN